MTLLISLPPPSEWSTGHVLLKNHNVWHFSNLFTKRCPRSPQAVSVGKPIEMDELCKQIALISTVSSADSKATLEALGLVLGSSMNTGRTVHVEGLGTFYYTCISNGKGVDSAEKVNANQISGTRVRFIPESRRQGSAITRALIGENVTWTNVSSISGLDGTGSGKPSGGDGGLEEDPLG